MGNMNIFELGQSIALNPRIILMILKKGYMPDSVRYVNGQIIFKVELAIIEIALYYKRQRVGSN